MPDSIEDLLTCWKNEVGRRSKKDFWEFIPLCLMWILWLETNSRIFNREEQFIPAIRSGVVRTCSRVVGTEGHLETSFIDFVLSFCN